VHLFLRYVTNETTHKSELGFDLGIEEKRELDMCVGFNLSGVNEDKDTKKNLANAANNIQNSIIINEANQELEFSSNIGIEAMQEQDIDIGFNLSCINGKINNPTSPANAANTDNKRFGPFCAITELF